MGKGKHIPTNKKDAETDFGGRPEVFQKWDEYDQSKEKEEYDKMIEEAMEEAYTAIENGTENETADDEIEKLSLIASNISAFAIGDIDKYLSWPLERIKRRIHSDQEHWMQRSRPDDTDDRASSRGYFLDGDR